MSAVDEILNENCQIYSIMGRLKNNHQIIDKNIVSLCNTRRLCKYLFDIVEVGQV